MAWHEADHFRGIRGFSDRCASLFAWTTPNLITLASLALTAPMIWALTTGRIALGGFFFALSALGDFLDGAVARYQHDRMSEDERLREREKFFLFQRGQSEGGLNLDPFTDKVRYFGALVPLGWGPLNGWLIGLGLAFAACLTIGRPVIKLLVQRNRLPEAQGVGKANKFGKFKAHAEIVLIAFLVFFSSVMKYALARFVGNVFLAIAAILGGASLGGQIYTFYKRWRAAKIKTTSV